jgi:hypothetical protein
LSPLVSGYRPPFNKAAAFWHIKTSGGIASPFYNLGEFYGFSGRQAPARGPQ